MIEKVFEQMLWVERAFDLEVSLAGADAAAVYAHLLANNHWKHHPLIVSWRETAPGEYAIIDRVPVFGLKLRVPYRSKVTALDAQTIRFEGFQNLVYVDNRTRVLHSANGCIVREDVTVRTLLPLASFVLAQTRRSHSGMLARLAAEFAAG